MPPSSAFRQVPSSLRAHRRPVSSSRYQHPESALAGAWISSQNTAAWKEVGQISRGDGKSKEICGGNK